MSLFAASRTLLGHSSSRLPLASQYFRAAASATRMEDLYCDIGTLSQHHQYRFFSYKSPAYKRHARRTKRHGNPRNPIPMGSKTDLPDRQVQDKRYNDHQPIRIPTLETACAMPISPRCMDNASLLILCALKVKSARAEMLIRHIMSVDKVSYFEANKTFDKIAKENKKGMLLASIPYQLGILSGVVAAFASMPLVFHFDTVHWFNANFVTTEVPEPEDLETWLEVGSWSWNWMEPPLGAISFALLCLQSARSQMINLGIRPYTSALLKRRSESVVSAFPQYDPRLISDYCVTVSFFDSNY